MKIPASIQPILKAVAPAVLTLVGVAVDWLVNGTFDRQTAAIAITGLAAALVTYIVPNATPATKVVVDAPAPTTPAAAPPA